MLIFFSSPVNGRGRKRAPDAIESPLGLERFAPPIPCKGGVDMAVVRFPVIVHSVMDVAAIQSGGGTGRSATAFSEYFMESSDPEK